MNAIRRNRRWTDAAPFTARMWSRYWNLRAVIRRNKPYLHDRAVVALILVAAVVLPMRVVEMFGGAA